MADVLRVLQIHTDDHLQRRRLSTAAASFTILIILFITTASASAVTLTPLQNAAGIAGDHQQQQQQLRGVGPGSSPPMCKSKCGHCSPCKAVHVAIHPGITVPLEYYPEAWRCKCGNNLFMP